MKKSIKPFRIFIIAAAIIFVWQLMVWALQIPKFILPAPQQVIISLVTNWKLIANNFLPTLIEILLGFLVGSLAGFLAALWIIYFRLARLWFLPVLIISQALPVFAIAPLLVIWFGYGIVSKAIVSALMLFFPVTSSFYDGLRNTPKEWLNLCKVMGASPWRVLYRIKIPAALPSLGTGLRVAASFAPMGAVIGEWVGSSQGLGFLMINANARLQVDLMFAVLLVLIALSLVLYFSIDQILKHVIFWRNTNY